MKNRFAVAVIILIVVNGTGLLVSLNGLDTFVVIAGFRFHIAPLIAFLLCYPLLNKAEVKNIFTSPAKTSVPVLLILIIGPLCIGTGGFYLAGLIETGDPEYFYELGLSSVIDYPVYLFWNLPQFILAYLVIRSLFDLKSGRAWLIFLFLSLLYLHELYPIGKEKWELLSIAEMVIASVFITGAMILIRNIYWVYVIIFSLLWAMFLSYGSDSTVIVAQLFASRYTGWEGFFTATGILSEYLILFHLIIASLLLLIAIFINKAR